MTEALLESLNDQQRAAVSHDTGPLLIIAGAGTGKTKVITTRILHLILDRKIKADQILALTFTEKAAEEMTERVDIAMPLGYEEVWIKTFHGFCEKVLRESGHEIGIDPSYKLLDQLQQWVFVKTHLFDFDLKYFRPLGNPNNFITTLITHFNRIKEETIPPEEYIEYAEKKVAEVRSKKEGEEIDPKTVLGVELEEAEKILEAARAYKTYQDLLMQENFVDFGDLSYFVLKLFEERPSVLAHYRKRFKYVMVDEFQDTNYAQFKLLMLLKGGTGEDADDRNICVVGDDDQSIFRWRGASLSNILQFKKAFPETKQIVLTENYRSNQNILDASHKFIKANDPDRLEARDGIAKDLHSQTSEVLPIKAVKFASYRDEVGFVVDKIRELTKEDAGGQRELEYQDLAILVRSNAAAIPFAESLRQAGIPYYIRNPKGLMSYSEIKDVYSVVRVVADQSDDIAFVRVLQFPCFEIPMRAITHLLTRSKKEKKHVSELLYEEIDHSSLPGMEGELAKFAGFFEEVLEYAKNRGASEVISHFLQKSGYLNDLAADFSADTQEKMNNITAFSKLVWDFEKTNDESSIFEFADYLKLIDSSNIPLSEGGSGDSDVHAVRIMTSHAAKGLEFDTVFVCNLVNHRFPILNKRDPLHVPIELTKEIFPEGDFHIEEERRLFYVAVTRAKRRLFLTYSEKYEGKKKWKTSQFLDEIGESGLIEDDDRTAQTATVSSSFPGFLEGGEAGEVAADSEAVPTPNIIKTAPRDNFLRSLSYSQIDTFNTCPLKYAYRYMLNVPGAPSHAANFGNSVHETLKDFYRVLMDGSGEVSMGLMGELYEKNWVSAGFESKEHEEARREQGLEMLQDFYDKNSTPWVVPEFVEKNFSIKIGEYIFTGRIDRIDKLEDGTYEVLDYKTGKSRALTKPHKLQMAVYALACREIFHIPVSGLAFYFLEDGEKISMKEVPKDLDKVRDEILENIAEIKASEFNPTPGFLCNFCDYRVICPGV